MLTRESTIDELLERYLSWCEECVALEAAYDRWAHAQEDDRPVAYANYVAQLEREEEAARRYEQGALSAPAAPNAERLAPAA
jgi:hypothetical protein